MQIDLIFPLKVNLNELKITIKFDENASIVETIHQSVVSTEEGIDEDLKQQTW